MNNKIIVQLDNQSTAEYQIVSFFAFNSTAKKYIIFTKNEVVNENLINLYVSEVISENDKYRIQNSMTQDEWMEIRGVMTNIITSKPVDNVKFLEGVGTVLSTDSLNARKLAVTEAQSKALVSFYENSAKEPLVVNVVAPNPGQEVANTPVAPVEQTPTPVENISAPVNESVIQPVENTPIEQAPAVAVEPQINPVAPTVEATAPTNTEPVQSIDSISPATNEIPTNPVTSETQVVAETSVMPEAATAPIDTNNNPTEPTNTEAVTPISVDPPQTDFTIPVSSTEVINPNLVGGTKIDTTNEDLVDKLKMAYVVENGDTLEGICKKFGYDVPRFLAYNKLAITATIMPGMILFFPSDDNIITNAEELRFKQLTDKIMRIAKNGGITYNDPLSGLNDAGELTVIN